MTVERVVLVLVVLAAIFYAAIIALGAIALWPLGLPVLVALLVAAGIFLWIVKDRLSSTEDDRYENKVDN